LPEEHANIEKDRVGRAIATLNLGHAVEDEGEKESLGTGKESGTERDGDREREFYRHRGQASGDSEMLGTGKESMQECWGQGKRVCGEREGSKRFKRA
jgi:hypothetical protein